MSSSSVLQKGLQGFKFNWDVLLDRAFKVGCIVMCQEIIDHFIRLLDAHMARDIL